MRASSGRSPLRLFLFLWLIVVMSGGMAIADPDSTSNADSLSAQIITLRAAGDYVQALEVARRKLALLSRDESVRPWERRDAQTLVSTLEFAAALPSDAQRELAEADRLTAAIERHSADGEYAQAAELADRQWRTLAQHFGDEHPEAIESLTRLALSMQSQGRYEEAEPLFCEAVRSRRERLGQEHPNIAASLDDLGALLADRGNYAGAESLLTEALAMRRRLFGEVHASVATSLNDLSTVYTYQNKYAEAEELLRQVLVLDEKLGRTEERDAAIHVSNLGSILDCRGKYEEAERYHREALAMRLRLFGREHPHVARSLHNLASALYQQGDVVSAEPLLREALALRRKLLGDEHPKIVLTLHNLAGLAYSRGDRVGAEKLYREAAALGARVLGDDHPSVSRSLHNVGLSLMALDETEEAEAFFRQALAMRRKVLGDEHPKVADSLQDLGRLLSHKNDVAGAEELLRESLAMRRQLLGDDHPKVALSLFYLAELRVKQGDYAEAESLYRNVLERRRTIYGDSHPGVVLALRSLGRCLLLQGDAAAAERLLSEAAATFETTRLRVGAGFSRSTHQASPYKPLALARLARGRPNDAWPAAEQALGRALADLLIASRHRSMDSSEVAREKSLEKNLGELEGRLATLRKTSRADTTAEILEEIEHTRSSLLEAEVAWSSFQQEISVKYPTTAGRAFALERVQASLAKKTAMVGWLHLELSGEESSSCPLSSWAYIILGSGPVRWIGLPLWWSDGSSPSPSAGAQAFREALALAASWRERVLDADEIDSHALNVWADWIRPLLPYLGGIENLIVIPSGPMLGVPVEALPDSTGTYVGDCYAVSYAPSATIYTWLAEGAAERGMQPVRNALLVGDPAFTKDQLVEMEEEDRNGGIARTLTALSPDAVTFRNASAGNDEALSRLPRLPWSRKEVERVASVVPQATSLVGPRASEEELAHLAETRAFRGFDTIHLATHALVDDEAPDRSALVLSRAILPDPLEVAVTGARIFDGLVTAEEIVREWELDANLVVLSGCQTGLGRKVAGEGYIGLAQAFLQAGARSVLVSLWRVEDEATALLMARFYENLVGDYEGDRGGRSGEAMTKATALQEAKRWLRTYHDASGRQPFRHPVYWSGFVLIGDPG